MPAGAFSLLRQKAAALARRHVIDPNWLPPTLTTERLIVRAFNEADTPAIFRHDSAQRRHSFAQSLTALSSGNRSQLTAHASHTSAQISHTRRCAGESRSMKLTQVAQKSMQSSSALM
jgi:hypothetical protein